MSESIFNNITFDMPKSPSTAIKVIGVGGGGSNAVNHMYSQDIKGVEFVICNTDAQALQNSSIPNKIQLGAGLTSGLGAGANPQVGEKAAQESIEQIEQVLNPQTKLVFITAGMGGGTGTGAAPIIAGIAKKLDILTVGIVTMPFMFEGRMRYKQAQKGIDELRNHVDSLIVINNNKLREVYGNLGFKAGFSKADEVLSTAARGIAEVITHHYKQNIDLHDAKTVLSNSGTAIMGSAKEAGEYRAQNAIMKALDSPLLNDNKITGAKNVLLLIVSGVNEVTLDEIGEINDYIQNEAGFDANIIMGVGEDESLGEAIAVTIVATGFALDQQKEITNAEVTKVYHTLNTEQTAQYDFEEPKLNIQRRRNKSSVSPSDKKVVHQLFDEEKNRKAKEEEVSDVSEEEFVINDVSPNLFSDLEEESTKETISPFDLPVSRLSKKEDSEEDELAQDLSLEIEGVEVDAVKKEFFNLGDLPIVDPEEDVFTRKEESKAEEKTVFSLEEESEEEEPKIENSDTKEDDLGIKKYTLGEFDKPTIQNSSTLDLSNRKKEKPATEHGDIKFEVRSTPIQNSKTVNDEDSPLNMSIDDLKKKSAEKSKSTLRNFNQRYKNAPYDEDLIEGIEKEPAYKRLGLELHNKQDVEKKSRSSVEITEDNELIIRRNNSFLHDNVD